MTARDTHEMRLQHWPRLSTFPTTAGFAVAIIGLDYATFGMWAILALALIVKADSAADVTAAIMTARTAIPDGWLLFLTGLHAGGITQFGIKRKTWDPSKAATESNGGTGSAHTGPTP